MGGGCHIGQGRTRRSGVEGLAGICQYNIISAGQEGSTACMRAPRRGKPNLGRGGVGQGRVSGTSPFAKSLRVSRNWPGKEGYSSEEAAYEKAWRCASLRCVCGIMRKERERAAQG